MCFTENEIDGESFLDLTEGDIKELVKLLGVVKTKTTPYHPQSDGLVERLNRTILNMLAISARERPFEWENHLQKVYMAYNSSVQPTTELWHL